ncbi:hypothetical protein CTI12_AA115960 [Artemisia annua]|uniref:CWF21 domain-containing protein n=1 Tax=Artemisia annua TaxID=35608 RepID=A0A2U1PT72_ARTAN|nr:hypothetical protein CTI12_AA115960 [Artemisia annua]
MYNGIGLQTARGSGTNGYIQTNKFFIKPKTNKHTTSKSFETGQGSGGVTRGPNKEILEHDRKRQIHLKLAVLEDKLIDQGYTDDEIALKLDEVRKTLEAAMASEDAGGATAVVLNPDHKYSDTQTHQLAARKEKQMENLKNALRIVTEDDLKKYVPVSDDEKIDDGDKAGHTKKTDPGFDGKLKKDTKAGKDGLDQLKQYKKKTNKRRETSSSDSSSGTDSDSSRENVKVSKKKHQKSRGGSDTESDSGSDSESDSDVDIRNNRKRSSSKHSKSKRHDSDDSRDTKRHVRNVKRYQSESDGNSSSDESPNIKSGKGKQLSSKSRRHDSDDDSDSESDASPVDKYGRRKMEDKRKLKRMESKSEKDISTRNDYGRGINDRWDGGSSKHDVPRDASPVRGRTHEKGRLERIGRRHDTDDEESDEDIHRKREEVDRRRQGRDSEAIDKNDIRLKDREVARGGRNEDSIRKDIKSDEKRHFEERKNERVESGGRRRHDGNDDADIDVRRRGENVERDGRRRHDVDLEPLDKKIRTGEKRQRDIEEHKKERVEVGGRRRHDSDDDDDIDARRTKQKVERDGRRGHDVDHEELIRTGRSRHSGIEENRKERVESAGRRRDDSVDDVDSDIDVKHTKVDRGGKRHEDVNYEKKTKIPTRDEQRHRSKTSDDEDEKYLEGRKENRDEEDRRGRKHKRDEDDDKQEKPEKGREHRESKYSREHDEERESRRGDRDRYADNSKRTRYDSERRHDGGRSRH